MKKSSAVYIALFGVIALFFSLVLFFRKDKPNEQLLEAARCGWVHNVQECIDCGADINVKDAENEWTPLHYAVTGGHTNVVALLIAKGVDINVKDDSGATPLHTAAALGLREIITLLLDYGAEINACNDLGFAPLLMAKAGGHQEIEELLVQYGAQEEENDMLEETRPLQAALQSGYKEMIEALIEHDAIGTRTGVFHVGITNT